MNNKKGFTLLENILFLLVVLMIVNDLLMMMNIINKVNSIAIIKDEVYEEGYQN